MSRSLNINAMEATLKVTYGNKWHCKTWTFISKGVRMFTWVCVSIYESCIIRKVISNPKHPGAIIFVILFFHCPYWWNGSMHNFREQEAPDKGLLGAGADQLWKDSERRPSGWNATCKCPRLVGGGCLGLSFSLIVSPFIAMISLAHYLHSDFLTA